MDTSPDIPEPVNPVGVIYQGKVANLVESQMSLKLVFDFSIDPTAYLGLLTIGNAIKLPLNCRLSEDNLMDCFANFNNGDTLTMYGAITEKHYKGIIDMHFGGQELRNISFNLKRSKKNFSSDQERNLEGL